MYSVLYNVADRAGLKRKSNVRKKICATKKSWYDCDCKSMYRQLKSLSRNIKCNPSNLNLVHSYRTLRKKYVKLLSNKKSAFRKSIFDRLDKIQSNDPQAFWKIYDELCEKKQVSDNPISPRQWWSHFVNLMNRNIPHMDTNFEDFINNFADNLGTDTINSLDDQITPSEIMKAARFFEKW